MLVKYHNENISIQYREKISSQFICPAEICFKSLLSIKFEYLLVKGAGGPDMINHQNSYRFYGVFGRDG